MTYQIFGSPSSQDIDIMLFKDDFDFLSIEELHQLIKNQNKLMYNLFDGRKINCNIGSIQNGILTKCFKGSPDECNNSLFETYKYHKQIYHNHIEKKIERDTDLKLIRFTRFILSFHSRGKFREEIKISLREGDIRTRLEILKKISISEISNDELLKKKVSRADYLKTCAFQFGQVLGIFSNTEFYTKEDIAKAYPNLKKFLFREISNEKILDDFLTDIIFLISINLSKMSKFIE